MSFSKSDREQAIERLREWVKPGDRIFTILRSVSRSGMSREISAVAFIDGELFNRRHLDRNLHLALGYPEAHQGVKVSGRGSDMGFEVVYNLGRVLFPNGFGVEGRRPNGKAVRPTSQKQAARLVAAGCLFRGRNGNTSGWDNDGGYALKHEWL